MLRSQLQLWQWALLDLNRDRQMSDSFEDEKWTYRFATRPGSRAGDDAAAGERWNRNKFVETTDACSKKNVRFL